MAVQSRLFPLWASVVCDLVHYGDKIILNERETWEKDTVRTIESHALFCTSLVRKYKLEVFVEGAKFS